MADRIQSTVRIIHVVEAPKPTEKDKTDEANKQEDVGKNKVKEKVKAQGIMKKLGKTAVKRRLANYAFDAVTKTVDIIYQNRAFKASFYGDTRRMIKEQETASRITHNINFVKGGVGAIITSTALKNPTLMYVWAGNEIFKLTQNIIQTQIALNQYNLLREKELLISSKRNERMIIGTYNRRG